MDDIQKMEMFRKLCMVINQLTIEVNALVNVQGQSLEVSKDNQRYLNSIHAELRDIKLIKQGRLSVRG